MRSSISISRGPEGAALNAGLALAGAGAALVLLGLFGAPVRIAGLAAMIAGTILSAPFAQRPGAIAGWWTLLAVGSALALAGSVLGLAVESLGGLVAVLGGASVAIGVVLGYPPR